MKRKSNYTAVYNNFPETPETFDYVNHTVLGVLRTICKNTSYTFDELLNFFPDELADHGGKFMAHPYVIKKQSDITDDDLKPKKRIFTDQPIRLKKENILIMVSNQWNNQSSESNFAYFCRAAKKHFNIDITED